MIKILEKMLLIRIFEEMVAENIKKGEIKCPVHLSIGQEGISATICEFLNDKDYVFSTHRNHGHYLAKGGNLNRLMAEIYCKETGCSNGKGGSMHVIDRSVNFMGSSAIVSGTIPIAVGAALTIKRHNTNQVSVAFFGDGATDEGIFYESINLSVLYNLPVIFVCENNDFATHLPNRMRQSNISVTERINGFKINSKNVDGNNPIEIYEVAGEMIERARKNCAPSLLECTTYRWLSHAGYWQDLDVGYRRKEDVEFWMNKCPIKYLYNYLKLDQKIDENQFELMKTEIRKKVTDAVLFARNSRSPNILNLDKGL